MQQPTLAGFINFVQNVMGISSDVLPTTSPLFGYCFETAMAIVNDALACVPSPPGAYTPYQQAVYNLGGDDLLNFAQDQPGAPVYRDGLPFFAYFRRLYRLNDFTPGVITNASDESTSGGLVTPEFMKNFTIANLQNLKTPYGRKYLSLAQSYGPTVWGLT